MGTNGGVKERPVDVQEVLTTEQSILDRIIEEAASMQQTSLIPSKREWDVYEAMANMAAGTPFYGKLGGKNGILAIMLYAREIGMPPMSALNGGIDNIMGRLAISAISVNEKIRLSGHQIQVKSISDKECTIWGKRKDTGEELTVRYTLEDAKRAGLFKPGGGYEKNPDDMMFARSISRMGRRLFPDVIKGAVIEGEVTEDRADDTSEKPQEQKPSTIAGMAAVDQKKTTATAKTIEPTKPVIDVPKQAEPTKTDEQQGQQAEPPKQEPPKTEPPKTSDQQSRNNGARIIFDKLSEYYGGDVQEINGFLAKSLPDSEVNPSMDNLNQFPVDLLKKIHEQVKVKVQEPRQ